MKGPSAQIVREALAERLDSLELRVTAALRHSEGRNTAQIRAAVRAVGRWVTGGSETLEEVLTWSGVGADLMIDYIGWTDKQVPLSVALKLKASPEWDYQEIFAVLSLLYVVLARECSEARTIKGAHLAAIAYGEAVEHFRSWAETRGRGLCRRPSQHELAISKAMDRVNAWPFIWERASQGGSARASVKAMKEIKKEWLEQEPTRRYRSDSIFAKEAYARHHPSIRSERSISNNIPKWRRERKAALN